MNVFRWVNIFLCGTQAQRKAVVKASLEAIKIYIKGKPSTEGSDAYKFLTSDNVELIGIVPNITYIRVQSKDPSDLEVLWDHKFSVPTMLYYVKGSPFLLLANPNVEYNNSKLLEIEENAELVELRDLKGIIG